LLARAALKGWNLLSRDRKGAVLYGSWPLAIGLSWGSQSWVQAGFLARPLNMREFLGLRGQLLRPTSVSLLLRAGGGLKGNLQARLPAPLGGRLHIMKGQSRGLASLTGTS
jgi:hypothetical protein